MFLSTPPPWGNLGGKTAVSETPVVDEEDPFNERERVHMMIETRLHEAGFTIEQAVAIWQAGADYHQALTMLGQGCSHERVVEILT